MVTRQLESSLRGKRVLIVPDAEGWDLFNAFTELSEAMREHVDVKIRIVCGRRVSRGGSDLAVLADWRQPVQLVDRPQEWICGVTNWAWGPTGHHDGEDEPCPSAISRLKEFRACYATTHNLHAALGDVPICRYVPFGVDTKSFYPKPRPIGGDLVVGWCGRPGFIKRQEVVESAVSILDGVVLRSLKFGNGASPSKQELVDFYQGLDVLVSASRADGLSRQLKEAAACGVPLVSTSAGAADTLINPHVSGLFFDGSVTDLVEKLVYLRDNRLALYEMRARVLARVAQYDVSFVALRWIRFFEECLSVVR
jgi:hypothetical protein